MGRAVTPAPTTVVPAADLTVWQFCDALIIGALTEAQSNAVYRLNEGELSKNREQSLPVVRLLRQLPFPTAQ